MKRHRWIGNTLTVRAVFVTCLVALISVAITAAVALPLALRSASEESRLQLAEKATVAANGIEGRDAPGAEQRQDVRARKVAQTLRSQGVETILVRDGVPDQKGLPPWIVKAVASGENVSQRVVYKGRLMLAEGRAAGSGDGIILLQQATTITWRTVLNRLWSALLAGLAAGLLAGLLLARRLGRPLRQVAMAARQLSAGDRQARAPTTAPSEVADVSVALNDLAEALVTSENRQRNFLMSVSHELRTPLTTIRGYAEALADGVVSADGAQRAGQTMLAESERLDRLVEDLLALARLEADDFPLESVPVDLVALVVNAAESWSQRCAAVGVSLHTQLPVQPVIVQADPGRVRQVVDGLLENALRVVPPGAPIVLAVYASERFGSVEVRDGGPGFTDDDLRVAFDRGALHERYKGIRKVGSGLGLALAARLVTRLGGTMEAGHAPEGGARMSVFLPSYVTRT